MGQRMSVRITRPRKITVLIQINKVPEQCNIGALPSWRLSVTISALWLRLAITICQRENSQN